MCLHGGGCHTLPVNGIETCEGIAYHQKTFREALELLIMSAQTGWISIGDDFCQRFRSGNDVVNIRCRQRSDIFEESCLIGWRMIAHVSTRCHDPTIALHWEEDSAMLFSRPGRKDHLAANLIFILLET